MNLNDMTPEEIKAVMDEGALKAMHTVAELVEPGSSTDVGVDLSDHAVAACAAILTATARFMLLGVQRSGNAEAAESVARCYEVLIGGFDDDKVAPAGVVGERADG